VTDPGDTQAVAGAAPAARSYRVHWRQLLAESAAVILSILAAFAIDAWWDGHQERQREHEILAGLRADFQSSRPGLKSRLELARRMAKGNSDLLELTRDRRDSEPLTVPDALILAVLGGPTYEPETNTLDAALASGEIELLQDSEVRAELANWRRILSDTGEDEREVRRITNEQVVPLMSRTLDLRPYYDKVLPWSGGDPFAAGRLIADNASGELQGQTPLAVDSELVGALALRRFYVEFAAADLEELLDSLDRLVSLLDAQLAH